MFDELEFRNEQASRTEKMSIRISRKDRISKKSGCIVRLEHALRLLFHCQKPVHLPFPRLWRSVPRLSCFVLHVKSRSVEIEPCVLTAGFGIQAALFQLYYAMHHLVSIEARLHASVCIDPVSEI